MTLRYRWWTPLAALAVLIAAWILGSVIIHSIARHHALEGTVIALDYNPTQFIWHPQLQTCAGNPPTCTTIPAWMQVIPENWNVRVRDDTATEDWHEVDQVVYESCVVGAYWPGEDGFCRTTR